MKEETALRLLEEFAQPLIKLLHEKYDPHCHIVISTDSVQVVRSEIYVPIEKE